MAVSQKTKPSRRATSRKPADRKLTSVARHVCQPKGIKTSGWAPVRDRCGQFGIGFDRWQDGMGTLTLGKRSDGMYAAGVGGVVVSIPRQTGKTFTFGWMVFALCTLYKDLTVVWTAHRTRTSDETFSKMRSMAMRPKVAPYIDGKPRSANGQQQIAFTTGSRILFGAREQGFGRGFDMVDILVFDEAQILTESALSDMVPATNAAPNGLVLMMGTPPRPKDPGEVFANRREDGLNGDPDTCYIEFSADRDANIIDWKQLEKANPSYPHRTSKTAILRMQKLLGSDENFRREAYGIWDEQITTKVTFPKDVWDPCKLPPRDVKQRVEGGRICYAVKFSVDGALVALSRAVRPRDKTIPVHVEGVKMAPVAHGTGLVLDYLKKHGKDAAQIVIEGKAGVGYLVNELREAGFRNKRQMIVPTTEQAVRAYSLVEARIRASMVTTIDQPQVDDELARLIKRPIGKDGGFGWQGIDGEAVTLFESMTLAAWAAMTTRRQPNRKVKGLA